jgi:hypothetical protein
VLDAGPVSICDSAPGAGDHAVFFDPATQVVTVNFSFDSVFDPPEQSTAAARFLALMANWMTALGASEEPQP